MAPKAKARGVRPARAGVRRPAAAVGHLGEGGRRRIPPRRRPAGAVDPAPGPVVWEEGREVYLRDVDVRDFKADQVVCFSQTWYFGNETKAVGYLKKVELIGEDVHLHVRLKGTTSKELLKVHGLDPTQLFVAHCCPDRCSKAASGDRYLHAEKGYLVRPGDHQEDWMSNLEHVVPPVVIPEAEDELHKLRQRSKELAAPAGGEAKLEKKGEKGSSSDSSKERKKKKKKKKKKRKEKKKSEDSEEEKKRRLDGSRPVTASQKSKAALFQGTGMDPKESVRKRVARKARKYMKKKKDKSSSSSSSSRTGSLSDDTREDLHDSLFGETNKAKGISERFPGVLFQEALYQMRSSLMTEQGEEMSGQEPKPVTVMYYRQEMRSKLSAAIQREALNLATAIDLLAKGKPAQAGDVLCQRLKALEAGASGTHWSITQKLEVAQADSSGIAQRLEMKNAQKENYEDHRTRVMNAGPGGKGKDEKGKGKGKGKEEKGRVKGDGKKDGKEKS